MSHQYEKKICRSILRKRLIAKNDQQDCSEKICQHLLAFPLFQQSQKILLFAGKAEEPLLFSLLPKILHSTRVFFPFLQEKTKEIQAREIRDTSDLEMGLFGILTPKKGEPCSPEELDFLCIPALGVAPDGVRLGRGGGYYDRFLRSAKGFRFGVLFSEQIFPDLPRDPWDEPLHGYVSEKGISWCSSFETL